MLGFVRANLNTTIAQVASRLALVWGVLELFPEYVNLIIMYSQADCLAERETRPSTFQWSSLGPSARLSDI